MFFFDAISVLIRRLISIFLLPFIDRPPSRNGAAREAHARDAALDMCEVPHDRNTNGLEKRRTSMQSVIAPDREPAGSNMESSIVTDSFISQLEQRTQQVKITLANLEAERTRIEEQIAQLTPLIPHYDALLAAERALAGANIGLDDTSAAEAPAPTDSDAPIEDESAPSTPSWTPYNP